MLVIRLDDFDLILGIDFMRKNHVVPMPHLDGAMVMSEARPCFVPCVHPFGKEGKKQKVEISSMSVKRGLKQGMETYLAALIEIKEDHILEVPNGVADVLAEFADVMPRELPNTLPPRRNINHKIELLPGCNSPSRPPYRMSHLELAELRKQLNELLDVGYIQPLKAPFGAPVLFQKK